MLGATFRVTMSMNYIHYSVNQQEALLDTLNLLPGQQQTAEIKFKARVMCLQVSDACCLLKYIIDVFVRDGLLRAPSAHKVKSVFFFLPALCCRSTSTPTQPSTSSAAWTLRE